MESRSINSLINAFLIIIFLLCLIGFIFIYSASSIYASEHFGSAHYFLNKQLLGFILGLISFMIARSIPFSWIHRYAPVFFILTAGVTCLTLVPAFGVMIHGSHRWLHIAGYSLQPSEFLKIGFILYLAYIMSKKQYTLHSLWHGYIPFLCIIGLTAGLLLLQPDFGQALTIGIAAFLVFFSAQANSKHILTTLGLAIPLVAVLIYIKPYRFKRILIFLNPWQDPQGAGFQIIQSLIAIGSGHIVGTGIAHSKQKFFYLPMQHTDFIFSIIAEETGFIGSSLVVLLYVLFLLIGFKLVLKTKDTFVSYTILGYVLLISLQSLINLSVVTGLLPTKGIGLPFVSAGNSSLIANLTMIGIILNGIRSNKGI